MYLLFEPGNATSLLGSCRLKEKERGCMRSRESWSLEGKPKYDCQNNWECMLDGQKQHMNLIAHLIYKRSSTKIMLLYHT